MGVIVAQTSFTERELADFAAGNAVCVREQWASSGDRDVLLQDAGHIFVPDVGLGVELDMMVRSSTM